MHLDVNRRHNGHVNHVALKCYCKRVNCGNETLMNSSCRNLAKELLYHARFPYGYDSLKIENTFSIPIIRNSIVSFEKILRNSTSKSSRHFPRLETTFSFCFPLIVNTAVYLVKYHIHVGIDNYSTRSINRTGRQEYGRRPNVAA